MAENTEILFTLHQTLRNTDKQPTVPYSASWLFAPNSRLAIRKQHTYLSEINIRISEIYLQKTAISKQKRNETSLKFGGVKKIYYLCIRKKIRL